MIIKVKDDNNNENKIKTKVEIKTKLVDTKINTENIVLNENIIREWIST